jgi:hypothetical protein
MPDGKRNKQISVMDGAWHIYGRVRSYVNLIGQNSVKLNAGKHGKTPKKGQAFF